MKTRLMMIALTLSLVSLFAAVAHAAPSKKGHKKADKTPITYIDASTPDAPSSEFPTIAKKGSL